MKHIPKHFSAIGFALFLAYQEAVALDANNPPSVAQTRWSSHKKLSWNLVASYLAGLIMIRNRQTLLSAGLIVLLNSPGGDKQWFKQ